MEKERRRKYLHRQVIKKAKQIVIERYGITLSTQEVKQLLDERRNYEQRRQNF